MRNVLSCFVRRVRRSKTLFITTRKSVRRVDRRGMLWYNARRMKKLIPVLILALGLTSCAVKTVSRTELFTPNAATLINTDELVKMKYYGSDAQYDYYTRGFSRLRVAKSEQSIPDAARFTFNNWQGGKLYTDCIKEVGTAKVQGLIDILKGAQVL